MVNRERKMVKVEKDTLDIDRLTLAEAVTVLKDNIKRYGKNATIEKYQEPYSDSWYWYLYAQVPETDAAYAERITSEEHYENLQESREKAEFERLKEKFGK